MLTDSRSAVGVSSDKNLGDNTPRRYKRFSRRITGSYCCNRPLHIQNRTAHIRLLPVCSQLWPLHAQRVDLLRADRVSKDRRPVRCDSHRGSCAAADRQMDVLPAGDNFRLQVGTPNPH